MIPLPSQLWDELRIRFGALRELSLEDGSLPRQLGRRLNPLDPRETLAFLSADAAHEVSAVAHATGWLQVLRRPCPGGTLWLLRRMRPLRQPKALPELDWLEQRRHWRLAQPEPRTHSPAAASTALSGPQARRCHVFGIGPPKAATTSLAGLFCNYHHQHEGLAKATLRRLQHHQEFSASWLLRRDRTLGYPECDSSQLHHWYLPALVDTFPAARFVLLLRQPLDWLNSWFNHRLARGLHPHWQALERIRFGSCDAVSSQSQDLLLSQHGLPGLQRALSFWLEVYQQALQTIPADRLMVLPVETMEVQLPQLARFAGISPESLQFGEAKRNRGVADYGLLARLPCDWINECIEAAASELWRTLRSSLGATLPSLKHARRNPSA